MKEAQAMEDAVQVDNDDEEEFSIDESTPYAELWLGTHANGMSQVSVKGKKQSLLEYVQGNPTLHCGSSCNELSFLLKVLSVRKVLSIQAHPDKQLAQQLHAERPTVYKDPNHKPEMAICLSERVRAMCGFRTLPEIRQFVLQHYPEFAAVLGEPLTTRLAAWKEGNNNSNEDKQLLRDIFRQYVTAPPDLVHAQVQAMVGRLRQVHGGTSWDSVQRLILQLEEQFPGDCGIFAPLLLNVMELTTGQALFIDANEPHAYISGEILECMACSDNVVRAGLTPKLKDVPTLVGMLTYRTGKPALTAGRAVDDCLLRYAPPVRDFLVDLVDVPPGETYELHEVDSPAVLLTLEGEACLKQGPVTLDMTFGLAAFVSAQTSCTILAGPYGVRLTRACTNIEFH